MEIRDDPSKPFDERGRGEPESGGSPPLDSGSPGQASPGEGAEAVARQVPAAPPEGAGGSATGENPPPAGKRRNGSFFEVAVVVLLALLLALLLKVYVAEAYEIRGRSMEDTFHQDERVMVLKVLYEIRRGDIIIFSSSENSRKDLIKRVIGLPDDLVEVRMGEVYVNGSRLEEPYAKATTRPVQFVEKVKAGKYFVLGDNRPDSQDSRIFHSIDASAIKGKVILRWWPLGRFDSF